MEIKMKPIPYLLILLSLFLTFSCEDDTPTNDDVGDDMMSLDWILLKKGVDTNFNVESCDGYEGYDCEGGNDNECGDFQLFPLKIEEVESCSGYELCEMGWVSLDDWWFEIGFGFGDYYTAISHYDCCYEYEVNDYDSLGNIIDTEIRYNNIEYLFYEYTLYWNEDLLVCGDSYCGEEDDIVIPSHIKESESHYCGYDDYCNTFNDWNNYFHPNCDTPLDTTMMIGNKSVSFEKMGWVDRDSYFGYIHYYPLDDLILSDGDDIDISNWIVVDYQRKE